MPARRHDHRRPLVDPTDLADAFASGVDLQDFEDWVRLVFWVEVAENGQATRRKVAPVVVPRSLLLALTQELRGSIGPDREARRH
jgi:hypothetical protein